MSGTNPPDDPALHPAARNYLLMGLTALAVILLVLLRRGFGGWSFLPVLVGLAGAMLRWRVAPLLTLICLGGLQFAMEGWTAALTHQPQGLPVPSPPFSLPDWILCGAALAYGASQYRLLSLTRATLPADRLYGAGFASRPARPESGGSAPGRSPDLVPPSEVGWLILALPLWALLAQLVWKLLPDELPLPLATRSLSVNLWRGMVVAWILGAGLLAAGGLLAHAGRRRMSREEGLLILQDVLWRETGREQRRVNSWLAWARGRRRGKNP